MVRDHESERLVEGMEEAGRGRAPKRGETKDLSHHARSEPHGSDTVSEGMSRAGRKTDRGIKR